MSKRFGNNSQTGAYGNVSIAASHCRLPEPGIVIPGLWQHGWAAPHRTLSPEYQFGECALTRDMHLWVARRDQECFLRNEAFPLARAIGLPAIYVPRSSTKRIPKSLLIVPAHSLEYTTHTWKFDEYAEQIDSIRGDFEVVAAIVHQDCIKKGYWVKQFERLKIEVIPGAHVSDPTSLYRLEAIFSAFEFVTSNSVGSHIAYASLWGAKVSIFGTYAAVREEDYSNTPFYQLFPHLLRPAIDGLSESVTNHYFPFLFVDHPKDAELRIAWAEFQVGMENKLSPQELRKAFGWTLPRRTAKRAYQLAAPIAEEWLPEAIKRPLLKRLYPQAPFQDVLGEEVKRLTLLPAYQAGSTSILGQELNFPSGPSCAYQLKSIFGQEVYKFRTTNSTPRIIDGGANIGLASIYFARCFPNANIQAYEPDEHICSILEHNLQSFNLNNVEVHRLALWTDDQGVSFASEGADAGKIVADNSARTQHVPSVRLRDLLQQPVELLKLDVEGAEVDLLIDCASSLQNVERIFVEYHAEFGKPQRLQELLGVLTQSGYRVHVLSPFPADQPFMHRPIKCGYDLLLEIFAVRAS